MKIKKSNSKAYHYAEEGLISTRDIGEGRLLPALVLDVEGNKDIEDLLRLHETVSGGDVKLQWSQEFYNRKFFILNLEFTRPMKIEFGIKFDLDNDYSLIDGIIQNKGFFLFTGSKGDKISKKLGDPRILVEVPDLGIKAFWEDLLVKILKEKYRKKGFSKKESKSASAQQIKEMRQIYRLRVNQ